MATDARARPASIGIVVEAPTGATRHIDSGYVPLLLGEIRHALEQLLATGAVHVTDPDKGELVEVKAW
jgi:hypothetical protein